MPIILDTDIVSIMFRKAQPAYASLHRRLALHPPQEIAVCIVSFQEEMKGWLAFINKARTPAKIVEAYGKLGKALREFCQMRVLPFDDAAQVRFTELRRNRIRIGTLDLRIASVALATGAILVSRNLRDFKHVPGLRVEDWTI